MTKEESYEDWIEEKIKNNAPLSELEFAIYSAGQDANGATIAFIFAFIIVPILIYLFVLK